MGVQLGSQILGCVWVMDSPDTRLVDTFQPECIWALDSLDAEGNSGTKQGILSSRMHPVGRHPDEKV